MLIASRSVLSTPPSLTLLSNPTREMLCPQTLEYPKSYLYGSFDPEDDYDFDDDDLLGDDLLNDLDGFEDDDFGRSSREDTFLDELDDYEDEDEYEDEEENEEYSEDDYDFEDEYEGGYGDDEGRYNQGINFESDLGLDPIDEDEDEYEDEDDYDDDDWD